MKCELIVDKLMGHAKDGKVGKIHVNCGSDIASGDVICTIESNKGSIKCTTKHTGKLLNLLIGEGDNVSIGDVIGYIESDSSNNNESKNNKRAYTFGLAKPKKEEIKADVTIVGGGPGGYVAAIRAAQLGQTVVLIESERVGGTCLNHGCIPTKSFAYTADLINKINKADAFGIKGLRPSIDMSTVCKRKNEVVNTLVSGIESLIESNSIKLLLGKAIVKDQSTISVKNDKIDATIISNKIILATGSIASKLPIQGADLPGVFTSKELLEIDYIPDMLAIIGGGVIGMEFAFIFAALGSQVTVIEYQESILSMLEPETIDLICKSAKSQGINIITEAKASKISQAIDGNLILEFEHNNQSLLVTSDIILMATGRSPYLESVELDKLNVELSEVTKGVKVNEFLQTTNPDVYAIGDLTNIIQLAHVASHQGIVAAEHIAGINHAMDYDYVPSAIFTNPEIGSVGLTEENAIKQGISTVVGMFPFAANGKALTMGVKEGFIKLIQNKETGFLIGGTIVGPHATDMLPTLVHLMKNKISVDDAINTIYAHPTAAEGIHESLLSLKGRAIHFG